MDIPEEIMKKGFTLIELLIVMVILGILVTISVPKYNAAVERGRAMEALTNLRAASEVLNTRYLVNDNAYTCSGVANSAGEFKVGTAPTANFTKATYFNEPTVADCTATANMSVSTARNTGEYTLTAYNEDGELKYITCTGDTDLCQNAGAEAGSDGVYKIDYGN